MKMSKELIENSLDSLSSVVDELILKTENLSDFMKNFPSTGVILSILKTACSIPNIIFAKKYISFAEQISKHNITENDLYAMLKCYHRNKNDFSEHIAIALNNCDRFEKSQIIAELIISLINHEINYEEFDHFINSIENMPLFALKNFSESYETPNYVYNQTLFGFLQANGFISMLDNNGDYVLDANAGIEDTYKLSDSGKKLGFLLQKYFKNKS